MDPESWPIWLYLMYRFILIPLACFCGLWVVVRLIRWMWEQPLPTPW